MICQTIPYRRTIAIGVASVLISIGGYTYLAYRQHVINPDDQTIPTWKQMASGLKQIVTPHQRSGETWLKQDAKATIIRLSISLIIGIFISIVLGISMGCLPTVEAIFNPLISFATKIPPTAIVAVFFAICGTDLNLYIAVISFGMIPSFAQSIYLSVKEAPEELIYKSYTIGASSFEVAWVFILRWVLPRIIDNIRLQIGPAMVYLIAAEMICADVGFGFRIRLQSRMLNMHIVYPYIIIIAMFGFVMDFFLKRSQQYLCPWYGGKK